MIYKTYYRSPIGLLEISSTKQAIISIQFANKKTKSAKHFLLNKCIQQLKEYFSGQRKTFKLPLALQGTAFQKKVWQALLKIPYGTTSSYQALAKSIGRPKAARAVGNANNKNKIAIVIPCHRVIAKDQTLSGYAGGVNRKRWLLNHEK